MPTLHFYCDVEINEETIVEALTSKNFFEHFSYGCSDLVDDIVESPYCIKLIMETMLEQMDGNFTDEMPYNDSTVEDCFHRILQYAIEEQEDEIKIFLENKDSDDDESEEEESEDDSDDSDSE